MYTTSTIIQMEIFIYEKCNSTPMVFQFFFFFFDEFEDRPYHIICFTEEGWWLLPDLGGRAEREEIRITVTATLIRPFG